MLIRGLSIHGKDKLADKWENDLHIVVDQPDESIPVCVVEPIGGGIRRTYIGMYFVQFHCRCLRISTDF